MIRKKHHHKLQTNQWYREEEQHNNHETPGRQSQVTTIVPTKSDVIFCLQLLSKILTCTLHLS